MPINQTKIYKYLEQKKDNFFIPKIDILSSQVSQILTRIPAMFSNYTNHDIEHSVRVADYMVELLPLKIEKYSDEVKLQLEIHHLWLPFHLYQTKYILLIFLMNPNLLPQA